MGAITTKGQVTLPKSIRNVLGVKPGDHVRFEILPGGDVRVVPVLAEVPDIGRWEKLIGCAGPGMTTDEIMAMTRGDTD